MPNWAGSCWYYLRYLDPANHETFCRPGQRAVLDGQAHAYRRGCPRRRTDPGGVDLYIGGVEHAVLHLLYARFWHKVLFDLGLVSSEEPFRKYFSQGMIQAYAYTDARGQYVPAEEVDETSGDHGEEPTFTWQGQPVNREYGKIGKSLKNVVSPDDMYDAYGADTFRVYEMSMGPLELGKPWETRAVVGQPAVPATVVAQRDRRDDGRGDRVRRRTRRGDADRACTGPSPAFARTSSTCGSTRRSPS